jgi:transcriptional activator of cad operon
VISEHHPASIVVGPWRAHRASGELVGEAGAERLEPKVMDLLFLLASRPGQVFLKEEIFAAVWPGVTVGDDTLARAVSKLRKRLGDDPKSPLFIETLPKRGYRLIGEVAEALPIRTAPIASSSFLAKWPRVVAAGSIMAALVCVVSIAALWSGDPSPHVATAATRTMVERADDFYFQYRRVDNESAIALYQRVLAESPDYVPALAGLANALVQKVIRWPDEPGVSVEMTKLGDALKAGRTQTVNARHYLSHAQALAQRAVDRTPNDPTALKALGFVLSAQKDFASAMKLYRRAVEVDRDAWGPLINIGDILEISGRSKEALPYFEAAYGAMTRVYDGQTARVRPWYAELGVLIGDRHRIAGDLRDAEVWYRRVLGYAPFHAAATARLAALLREAGDATGAAKLCSDLSQRIGSAPECAVQPAHNG